MGPPPQGSRTLSSQQRCFRTPTGSVPVGAELRLQVEVIVQNAQHWRGVDAQREVSAGQQRTTPLLFLHLVL